MNLKLIREQIDVLGLKRGRLAERIGVHRNTLNNFLSGKSDLGSEALTKLLVILNLKPEALMASA